MGHVAKPSICHWHFEYRPCNQCREYTDLHRTGTAHDGADCPHCLLEVE